MRNEKTFVISVGGSLIVPREGIDAVFLKKLRSLLLGQIKQNKKFFIISGGGLTARQYINAAAKIAAITAEDKDWLGIHSTRLNAHLLRTIFRDVSYPTLIKNPTLAIKTSKKIIVGAGWRPGCSTDYDAVLIAKTHGIKTLINLSNIDYVYDKDPNKYRDAKKIEKIDWANFRKLVGNKWDPGLNAPFDPIASREAQKLGIEVAIMNGNNLNNLKNCLEGKKIKGTVIK
jgi:uridylate kinase